MRRFDTISVILPVYNGLPLLKESVESVLSQTLYNFRLLIADDCSNDGSWEYLLSLRDNRIRLTRNEKNQGLFENLNILLRQVDTELIHLWSQDDIMLPYCLEKTLEFHNKYPHTAYTFSKFLIINGEGKVIRENAINKNDLISPEGHAISSLIAGSMPGNIATVSFKKKDIKEHGLFNANLKYSGDFDMWARLSENRPVGIIQEHLIKLRAHPEQLSRKPSMWIYRLKENYDIFNIFLNRVSASKLKYVIKGLNWRVYTQYFSLLIHLFLNGKWKLAFKYGKELSKQRNIVGIWGRWMVINLVRLVGKEKEVYQKIYYNKLNK